MTDTITIINTNLNSLDEDKVSRIHDLLTEITGEVSDVQILCCQELGRKDGIIRTPRIPPFFDAPPRINEEARTDMECRGVCTFSDPNSSRHPTDQKPARPENFVIPTTVHETVATFHYYTKESNRNKITKFALIVVYVNHNRDKRKITSDIVAIMENCKRARVNKFIVLGDFNQTKVAIPGLREIEDENWTHQHHSEAAPTRIDKLFTNLPDVRIVRVMKSLETKAIANPELGHKTVMITVGAKPPTYKRTSINLGRLFQNHKKEIATLKGRTPDWANLWIDRNDSVAIIPKIDKACDNLYEYLEELTASASKTVETTGVAPHQLIQDSIDTAEENFRCDKKAKGFYNMVNNYKNGLEKASKHMPKSEKFVEKLETKIGNMKEVDEVRVNTTIDACYPETAETAQEVATRLKFPEREEFDKIMKSVNKSGASDYKGVTTKVTSFLYCRSIVLRSYFYQLFKLICFTGHIPVRLKIDKICFLWK